MKLMFQWGLNLAGCVGFGLKKAICLAKSSTLLKVGAHPASPSTPDTWLGLILTCLESVQGRGLSSLHIWYRSHTCGGGWQRLIMRIHV